MTGIEGRTSFARPPEELFDFLADPRNEPAYNPLILSARKVTPGPIGVGSRFVQRAKSFGGVGGVDGPTQKAPGAWTGDRITAIRTDRNGLRTRQAELDVLHPVAGA